MYGKKIVYAPFSPGSTGGGNETRCPVQHQPVCAVSFPANHDLSKLKALWLGEESKAISIPVKLWSGDGSRALMSVENLGRESARLRLALSYASHTRVALMAQVRAGERAGLDEEMVVFVSKDGASAWMFLLPPFEQGEELSTTRRCECLVKYGVVHGIDWGLLRRISQDPKRYFQLYPIARGTAPVPGHDGRIVDRYPRNVEDTVAVSELAKADYVTLKLVQEIQENDVICQIIPPGHGAAGSTVTGQILPAADGRAALVPQGRNTRLSEDGKYLVAAIQGHLAFSGRNFHVKPVMHVRESDIPATRTVRYLGDIHVHCDLCCGVSVYAAGTVQVDGVVESCTIEAGESIIVSNGVQGQGQAVLRAQRSVYAKYLEYCQVYAQESVQADCIMNCTVYSNGTVRARTGRGAIIGGTVRASREVSAITVGSKAERPTSIFLGGQPCEEAEREQIMKELEETERVLTRWNVGQPGQGEEKPKLSQLKLSQRVAQLKLEKIDKDLEEKRTAFLNSGCDRRRLCCDTAYPGTTVSIDRGAFRVEREEHSCTIGVLDGLVGRL